MPLLYSLKLTSSSMSSNSDEWREEESSSEEEEEEVRHISKRRKTPTGAYAPKRMQNVYVVDDEAYEKGIAKVRQLQSHFVDHEARLDIIAAHLHLFHEAWKAKKKKGHPAKHNFAQEVAALLRRQTKLCSDVWRQFTKNQVRVETRMYVCFC